MSFLDLVESDPGAPAVNDLRVTRTRGELLDRALRLAQVLKELGLRPGDHVVEVLGNRAEFLDINLACILSGLWVTPLNWHLTADEAEYVIRDSTAKVVFADSETIELAHDTIGGTFPVLEVGATLDHLLATVNPAPLDPGATPGGTMFYTSGTTGRPKGVKRQLASCVQDSMEASASTGRRIGLDGSGPHLIPGPLYHAAPFGFGVMDLYNGAELVVMPRFDEVEVLNLIDGMNIVHTHLVPTMFIRLLRLGASRREAFSGGSLRTVLHGAGPISIAVKRAMIDWWGPVLTEYWGASEGGVVTIADSASWLANPGTVGRALVHQEVWAADEDGKRLPPGDIGLLWCRNSAMSEVFRYHGDEVKTTEAHGTEPGVYTIGDVGWVDKDGAVFLADRKSNMIISGGVNIYPAEIEQVLAEHPAIADVAVFGIPDDEWGESVKAAVELHADVAWTADTERGIRDWARTRLASFKVPRSVDHHDRLPRDDNGKLYKRLLRDPYWTKEGRRI